MKRSFILLLVLSAAACREEKTPQIQAAPREKAVRPVSAPIVSRPLPPPLLKTPRVTISFGGKGLFHSVIQNSDQAEAILADIRSLPPSAGRDFAISSVIGGLAKVDPGQARVFLEKWNDGLISRWLEAADAVAKNLAKGDPEAGAKFIEESVPRAAQVDVWNRFLAEISPAERLPFFERIPESSSKLRIGAALVLVWLREDPASCAAWLDDFAAGKSPEERRDLGNPSYYPSPMKTESAAWLAAFRVAKNSEAREILAEGVWKNADAAAKAGLIPELQDVIPKQIEEQKEQTIAADPAGYTAGLSASQITALSHDEMAKIIEPWARTHPLDAIQWALDHGRSEAATALGPLYHLEPKTALALAPKLPAGRDRDQAISSLCYSLIKDAGPDAAKAVLPLITDPEFREGMRKEIDHDWDEKPGDGGNGF